MKLYLKKMDSPVGELTLVANEKELVAILWETDRPSRVKLNGGLSEEKNRILKKVELQLKEYFLGKRTRFDIPLRAAGTAFQQRVWKALQTIPYGTTLSYADLAKKVGSPKAVRAVGAANGRNPLSIIVPCHRVIGSNGKLTGFAGGLRVKQQLLDLEARSKIV